MLNVESLFDDVQAALELMSMDDGTAGTSEILSDGKESGVFFPYIAPRHEDTEQLN